MSKLVKTDRDYAQWIIELGRRYRSAQVKASIHVNQEMLRLYWSIGKDLTDRDVDMKRFYVMYSNAATNFPQLVGNLENLLFSIPWGHHRILIDKFYNEPSSALFYLRKIINDGWSRNILLNFVDTNLHLREGNAVTNFKGNLPPADSELAQQITRDPYIFDFTNLRAPYVERELKDLLIANISKFLLELGSGFAYVGREYRLKIGNTEKFTDLLFYHLKLRCYVVIEVKTVEFDASHLGQLGLYVNAVNHLLKSEQDNPTIGLLVCKTKDDVVAQYSLDGYNLPLGISEYSLSSLIPDNFKGSLPTIEDIETELKEALK